MCGGDNRRTVERVTRTLFNAKRIEETDRQTTVAGDALFLHNLCQWWLLCCKRRREQR
jgi:hypothetical protein